MEGSDYPKKKIIIDDVYIVMDLSRLKLIAKHLNIEINASVKQES